VVLVLPLNTSLVNAHPLLLVGPIVLVQAMYLVMGFQLVMLFAQGGKFVLVPIPVVVPMVGSAHRDQPLLMSAPNVLVTQDFIGTVTDVLSARLKMVFVQSLTTAKHALLSIVLSIHIVIQPLLIPVMAPVSVI